MTTLNVPINSSSEVQHRRQMALAINWMLNNNSFSGRIVQPESFGASGAATDQSAYINAAIASLASTGGIVFFPQDYQINNPVLMYPHVKLQFVLGTKLVAGAVMATMLKSYSASKLYGFQSENMYLDGNNLAVNGFDFSGMNISNFGDTETDNFTGKGIYGTNASVGTYGNLFSGQTVVSNCSTGADFSTTDVTVIRLSADNCDIGAKFNASDIYILTFYGLANTKHLQFLYRAASIGTAYFEQGTYRWELGPVARNNSIAKIIFDAGIVLPQLDNRIDPDSYGNDFNMVPNLDKSSTNLLKNGDFRQWENATSPLGWFTSGTVSQDILSDDEYACKLSVAGAASSYVSQGLSSHPTLVNPDEPISPIRLNAGDNSLTVSFWYKRATTTMHPSTGSIGWSPALVFYNENQNEIDTYATPSGSATQWTTVVNDTGFTLWRNVIAMPQGTVSVGMNVKVTGTGATTDGSLTIRGLSLYQGIAPADQPRDYLPIYGKDATEFDTPTYGTFKVHDTFYRRPFATGKVPFKQCTVAGTAGTLAGVTGDITDTEYTLTVNTTVGLYPGCYITIVGVSDTKKVVSIDGLVVTINKAADATVAGAAVAYSAPTFVDITAVP